MLLRSSSAPILSSLLHYSKESSSEQEQILHLPRAISVLSLNQTLLESELHNNNTPSPKRKTFLPRNSKVLKTHHHHHHHHNSSSKIKEKDEVMNDVKQDRNYIISEESKASSSVHGLFSSSGLDKGVMVLEDSVNGGGIGYDGGGNGRGRGRGRDYFSEDSNNNNNNGRDRTNAYYQNMIEANPNDALLLGNYAKFLKEVCGDYSRAKEILERAILATTPDGGDGDILSLYADLVWQTEKNPERAEDYFDQAIKSAPHDCYVMASYAKFLWEAEEKEESEDNHAYCAPDADHNDLFQGINQHPHLTVAS